MIDTIRFTISARLRPQYNAPDALPIDWRATACGALASDRSSQRLKIHCDHLGLRIFGCQSCFTSVEVSLPRIIWGHNGRLIKSDKEFGNALAWLQYLLGTILLPSLPNDGFIPGFTARTTGCHYTRVDVVWQFPACDGVLAALRYARHAKIRSDPSVFKGRGVSLKGTFLEILAYDKVRQMHLMKAITHEVHRVEIRLRGKALDDVYRYADGRGYTRLDYDWCQEMLRRVANETHAPLPPAGGSACIHQFIADLEAEYPHIGIVNRYILSQGLTRESARKFRNVVATRRRPPQGTREVADLFPADAWPPPVEIDLPDVEKRHYGWLREYAERFGSVTGGAAQ